MKSKRLPGLFSVVLVSIALALTPLVAAAAKAKKPNILVIWGDDIGQSNISHYTRGQIGRASCRERVFRAV